REDRLRTPSRNCRAADWDRPAANLILNLWSQKRRQLDSAAAPVFRALERGQVSDRDVCVGCRRSMPTGVAMTRLNRAWTMLHAPMHSSIDRMMARILLSEFLVGGVGALSSAPLSRRHIGRNQQHNQQQTDCSQTLHHHVVLLNLADKRMPPWLRRFRLAEVACRAETINRRRKY